MAIGVAFSIKSNLGVSPVNSIPYVLSLVTKINQGLLTTIIFSIYVLLQIIILRRQFKPIQLLQIVFSGIFGYFVSFANFMLQGIESPSNYILKLVFLGVSIFVVAVGILLYLTANIMPQPPEGLMLAICKKTGIQFHKMKITFDSTVVVIAAAISFIAFGKLNGVREGTIISAILIGKILGALTKRWESTIVELIFNKNTNTFINQEE
jgi:uncharacterized membrane protein YczE